MEVIMTVESLDETKLRLKKAFRGQRQGSWITFASVELMFKVMTVKRWEIVRTMTGAGPLSIRETARRVGRDVKAVHRDIHALLDAGIIDRDGDKVVFPYDAIHLDAKLKAAE